jgi:ribosomal protein L3
VLKIDAENGLLVIKGPLPGAIGGLLFIQQSRNVTAAKLAGK